jgi:hypothetical protein
MQEANGVKLQFGSADHHLESYTARLKDSPANDTA